MAWIAPPEVRLPISLQTSPESGYHQSQSTVLYFLWDAMRKLGTSSSVILPDTTFQESFVVVCSNETTSLTAGTAKVTFRMPYDYTLEEVSASVNTAPTGATALVVDIGMDGVSILGTPLTFDTGTKITGSATDLGYGTPAVIFTPDLTARSEIRFDITSVGSTIAGAGLKVTLIGRKAT